MARISISDILAVLRRYDVATDENYNRQIDQVKKTSPTEKSVLITFRFQKKKFFLLFDFDTTDDLELVRDLITQADANAEGAFLLNPHSEFDTYAMPFKGKEVYLFEVDSQKSRLDAELAQRYPDTSRATWQKYIKAAYVTVNGKVETKPKFEVSEADTIAVDVPKAQDFSEHELPIIFLDDNVIVVNKPIGVLTHSKGAMNDEFTVASFFARYTNWGVGSNRPGIVHRLDRDTSGVIIGARNQETAELLQKQFADRKTKKTYYAVTNGIPKNAKALIDVPIARHPSSPSTFRADPKGKSAQTAYEVLATNGKQALIRLEPKTGRTHQLRVHMAYLNTPILGDRVYGKAADRLFLHAAKLEVTIPVSDRKTFEAPIPQAFLDLFPEFHPEHL